MRTSAVDDGESISANVESELIQSVSSCTYLPPTARLTEKGTSCHASREKERSLRAGEPGQLAGGCQSGKLVLHCIDSCEIVSHVVVAAPFAGGQAKAARGIGAAGSGSTEVDHCGQILLLLERGSGYPPVPNRACNGAIQEGRSQLNGMAWQDAGVEAVEPARFQVVPGAVFHHQVVVDAVAFRFAERPVGDLVHADRARRRLVQLQGIPCQLPTPVGPGHGVPPALHLGERSQQFGCDDRGRMLAEERSVLLPRLGGALVERL